ncbi:transcription factor PIF3-like [Dioscorea cayenensis subsp. rotundata]|uniref:Transcription factor PIF3-like n=1 Tax=Dioscorea cayennensis subsp. rotundata TaxID=55577 RepID=A0AB40C449_DIOCR|nr:transcription factor PIF3-like [Dioscorea cayenensis subsp. rotundata]
MDHYVPDYELEDDGIYNQLPALSPIINGPILPSNEVDLLGLIWRKGNIEELDEQPLKVLIHELEMELWLHCENKRLEDNLARFETTCMDPMMSVVNYMVPSLEQPLPIMELSKEDHGMIDDGDNDDDDDDDDDDDQMLISVVRGKVYENSKELMAVVEDSTDNVAPPPVVVMAASDQASSSMSRGKKRKPVISEAPPSDPVPEVVDDESGEKEQRNGKTAPGKKTRAAAVHNLSERVDKASMLDEAIEYVKSLQNQVKAMSVKMNSMNSMKYTAAPGVPYYTPIGMNLTMMMGG